MAEKWRKDKTIPLVDVVSIFQVYLDDSNVEKASKQELENNFGTSNIDDIVKKICEEGEIYPPSDFLSSKKPGK